MVAILVSSTVGKYIELIGEFAKRFSYYFTFFFLCTWYKWLGVNRL